ncbi:ABC transporter ATP-binding protein [Albimonas pacifica]|uniref:ABC-type bacteriocin/lantibiotic exporter, contains an N-terminal double-glycine peptidase domain n=1 Tax=Albimonas pacifica TaxID=1114924 RepID=A0A1I3IK23_9RHOB|nr:ABC transporter ATP-binding protein [Albimonas pacifica]SFI48375.1 ABC-type bacteriocin/lantibiotic exporter, contains an N-terminal double-glycine peptidase domain [Albimonas pacifica]
MLKAWRKTMDMFDAQERRNFWRLIAQVVAMSFANMVGIAMIIPFLHVLADTEATSGDGIIGRIYRFGGFETVIGFQMALGAVALIVYLGSVSVRALTAWSLSRFTSMRVFSISHRILRGYLGQPYVWFLGRHSSDLVKTVMNETIMLVQGTVRPMLDVISNGAVALAMIVLLVLADPLSALIMAAIMGGSYGLLYTWVRAKQVAAGRIRFKATAECYRIVQEAMIGAKEIKVLGLEQQMLARFRHPALAKARAEATFRVLSQVPRHFLEGAAFGGMIVVLLVILRVNDGDMARALPIAGVYALAGARLMPALQGVYGGLSSIRYQAPTLENLHAELRDAAAVGDRLPEADGEPLRLQRRLELRDLVYAYPSADRPALRGVSLEVEARTTVGIVGGTGAGKSTAMDILLGLLEPEGGQMLVDDKPIESRADRRAWRRSIGYVPQHIFLADDTVAANIAFGLPPEKIDMEAVERAARMAELHDFVTEQLPDGYQTLVGDRGARLSGGQRQRVGIARALYHDPDVLILDEATSALDNVTERAVMDALDRIGGAKTVIMVAHRLSTVRNCDRIFLFRNGVVEASGPYDQLFETSDAFRAMVQAAE